ncbi:50S ribosomal protein L1 [bacterium]|jgi:large subunit ribosomal protein L1|nr:50S ribosomal protein L1 [bacterium]
MKRGKNWRTAKESIDSAKAYTLEEAVSLLESLPKRKFDESVDLAVRLNVDPRHADQNIRGTVVLPNGTGKDVRVLVITRGPKEEEATAAGADMVGSDEFLTKIDSGWTDVDVIIATPDMMGELGKRGRVLGPRGLMPNPKVGTVTMDIEKAVKEAKAGRVEYRVDKSGVVHVGVGKRSFNAVQLVENAGVLLRELMRVKPSSLKGSYVRSIYLSGTMTPSFPIDIVEMGK